MSTKCMVIKETLLFTYCTFMFGSVQFKINKTRVLFDLKSDESFVKAPFTL